MSAFGKNSAFFTIFCIRSIPYYHSHENLWNVKIVENFGVDDEEVDFSKDEGEDTLTILNKYIEDSDFELSKEIVKNLMKEVYQQACELD